MHPLPEYMPALITPFTQREEIDRKAHTHNMRVLADYGIEEFGCTSVLGCDFSRFQRPRSVTNE